MDSIVRFDPLAGVIGPSGTSVIAGVPAFGLGLAPVLGGVIVAGIVAALIINDDDDKRFPPAPLSPKGADRAQLLARRLGASKVVSLYVVPACRHLRSAIDDPQRFARS